MKKFFAATVFAALSVTAIADVDINVNKAITPTGETSVDQPLSRDEQKAVERFCGVELNQKRPVCKMRKEAQDKAKAALQSDKAEKKGKFTDEELKEIKALCDKYPRRKISVCRMNEVKN